MFKFEFKYDFTEISRFEKGKQVIMPEVPTTEVSIKTATGKELMNSVVKLKNFPLTDFTSGDTPR